MKVHWACTKWHHLPARLQRFKLGEYSWQDESQRRNSQHTGVAVTI